MLSVRTINENPQMVVERLKVKNFESERLIDEITTLDTRRRQIKSALDTSLAESNRISKQIGLLFREGKKEEAGRAKEQTSEIKEKIKEFQQELSVTESRLSDLVVQLPNVPHDSVPPGNTPGDNKLVREGGRRPSLDKDVLPHWELARKYDIIDFELGNKITGAGFPVYKGKAAKLQRALISFFLDEAVNAGYTEIMPPVMVNADSAFGTGQLPDKEGQMYHVGQDNLYLIPTAEVPLTNIFRNEIIPYGELPRKLTSYTPCFRREAGSWGRDVRGLNRLHQFDKVEIVEIAHPESSYERLEAMTSYIESLVVKLELPYRILLLCGGDMSFHASKTYDFEVFSAAQEKWLEVSSVSNFESFQSNRMMLRYREKDGKKINNAHTLNGSALALPRIVAALLENNQTPEGIRIPGVLAGRCGFDIIGS